MTDALDLAIKIGLPALGTVAGWVVAAWRAKRHIEDTLTGLRLDVASVQTEMRAMGAAMNDLRQATKDLRDEAEGYASDGEFEQFMREMRENANRWERTMGKIEGTLESLLRPRR